MVAEIPASAKEVFVVVAEVPASAKEVFVVVAEIPASAKEVSGMVAEVPATAMSQGRIGRFRQPALKYGGKDRRYSDYLLILCGKGALL